MFDISFREMQVVEGLARLKSFSAAAKELSVSQSAISHTIADLEKKLDITLFTRSKNAVEPTKFAEPLLTHFESINQTLADARDALVGSKLKFLSTLKIQTGFRSNALWLTPAIIALLKSNQDLSIDIQINLRECQKNLAMGHVDLVISSFDLFPDQSLFLAEKIGAYQNVFLARFAHPLANKRCLNLADLKSYPLIGDPLIINNHNTFLKEPGKMGYYDEKSNIFYPALRLRSFNEIIEILKTSDAISFLPKNLIINSLKNNSISVLDPSGFQDRNNDIFALFRKTNKSNSTLKALIGELKRAADMELHDFQLPER